MAPLQLSAWICPICQKEKAGNEECCCGRFRPLRNPRFLQSRWDTKAVVPPARWGRYQVAILTFFLSAAAIAVAILLWGGKIAPFIYSMF